MSGKKVKQTISQLFSILYRNVVYKERITEAEAKELNNQLNYFLSYTFPNKYQNNKKSNSPNPDIEEDIGQLLSNLIARFSKGRNEAFESREEKRILAYIKSCMNTVFKNNTKGLPEYHNTYFRQIVEKICNELVSGGVVKATGKSSNKRYFSVELTDPQNYKDKEILLGNFKLYRGDSFNHVEIRNVLIKIFSENFSFSISELLEIIINNSDIEMYKSERIDNQGFDTDENNSETEDQFSKEIIDENPYSSFSDETDDSTTVAYEINTLLLNIKEIYKDSEKLKRDLFIFYLRAKLECKYQEISDVYFNNSIGKSTVEAGYKAILSIIERYFRIINPGYSEDFSNVKSKEINNGKDVSSKFSIEFQNLFSAFWERLDDEYNFNGVIESKKSNSRNSKE